MSEHLRGAGDFSAQEAQLEPAPIQRRPVQKTPDADRYARWAAASTELSELQRQTLQHLGTIRITRAPWRERYEREVEQPFAEGIGNARKALASSRIKANEVEASIGDLDRAFIERWHAFDMTVLDEAITGVDMEGAERWNTTLYPRFQALARDQDALLSGGVDACRRLARNELAMLEQRRAGEEGRVREVLESDAAWVRTSLGQLRAMVEAAGVRDKDDTRPAVSRPPQGP